ncbi:hypothetical protein [Mesorhizobium sp.]|uniref:hypothetical protein n=1 Tax=Mesorhizobium sp. TaxID=1871066 RepID=UPI000FE79DBC|nr:hypothetical protein [Mesorhizobium sp.]RWO90909.1 MAG: hypothetical protein EOQ95_13615 [Mesorhizobium sp.]
MEKSFKLTQHELDSIDTIPRFGGEEQSLVLDLRKRSGIRYGVNVGGGIFNIVKCAFAINRKGLPTGAANVETVRGGLRHQDVVPAIREMLAAL